MFGLMSLGFMQWLCLVILHILLVSDTELELHQYLYQTELNTTFLIRQIHILENTIFINFPACIR